MQIGKYLKERMGSFKFAFLGLKLLMYEANFRIHVIAFILVIALSFYFKISNQEWLFILVSSFLVLICEAINTAIEKTMDFISVEKNNFIANIKDISAAFVLISAVNAIVVAAIIFIPKL
jgi:diacylglycerol kinase (ATP)